MIAAMTIVKKLFSESVGFVVGATLFAAAHFALQWLVN